MLAHWTFLQRVWLRLARGPRNTYLPSTSHCPMKSFKGNSYIEQSRLSECFPLAPGPGKNASEPGWTMRRRPFAYTGLAHVAQIMQTTPNFGSFQSNLGKRQHTFYLSYLFHDGSGQSKSPPRLIHKKMIDLGLIR